MVRKKTTPAPKTPLTAAFNPSEVVDPGTGQTRLLAALDDGARLADIRQLLKLGADPCKADLSGRTPMDAAMARRFYRAADLLIAAGAKPPAYDGAPDGPLVYKPYRGTVYTAEKEKMERETPLTYFIKECNTFDQIYPILANGADVNRRNKSRETPLQVAVERNWPYVARELVRRGAWIDPDKSDPDEVVDAKTGATRLISMIMEGEDAASVKRILDQGADPDKPDRYGLTPLALARALGWPYVEKMLLERGANPGVKFPDPNQDVGAPGKETMPMLVYATTYQSCHPNYFLALLKAGADPDAADAEGRTSAYYCAVYDKAWHFDVLEQAGADVFKKSDDGVSALHMAALNNHPGIMARLLETAPVSEVNFATKEGQQSPVYLACTKEGTDEIVDMLIDLGADIKFATKHGDTPLHEAARNGTPALVRRLLDLGADVNAADQEGNTPLIEAIRGDSPEKVRILLEHGASIDKANESKYYHPLYMTVSHTLEHKGDIMRLLLQHGGDPNAYSTKELNASEGGSILYQAIMRHAPDAARVLLEAGADPHGTSYIGESAMHYCLHLRYVGGAKLLLDYGFDPLKVWDFTTRWSGGGGDHDERTLGSAYDEALKMDKKFGHDTEYGKMLDLIEERLAAPAPAQAAPSAKPSAARKPSI